MTRGIHMRAGVRAELQTRHVRRIAAGNLRAGRDANHGISGVNHPAISHRNGDVVEACHAGILSDLSPMRKLALLTVSTAVVTACHSAPPPSTTGTPERPAREN